MSHACSVSTHIEDIISGQIECLKMPWPLLTELTSALLPGTITLICGGPGCSKSFMVYQALLAWYADGYPVAVYEMEGDIKFHLQRILAQKTATSGLLNYKWIKQNPDAVRSVLSDNHDFMQEFGQCIQTRGKTLPTFIDTAQWIEKKAIEGCRVIVVDPVSFISESTRQPWEEVKHFLSAVDQIATKYKTSIILITHTKGTAEDKPDMALISGATGYSKWTHTILWLQSHPMKQTDYKTWAGTLSTEHNRTAHILKVRHGKGEHMRIAMTFGSESLSFTEHGIIIAKKKGNKE